jgi:hypothetical protein
MSRPRFSLRAMLLLTVAVAALCWYRDLPRQNAERFIALVEARDYEAAEAMFPGGRVGISNKPTGMIDWEATRERQSALDWLCGRCYVNVTGGLANYRYLFPAVATATGMRRTSDWEITLEGKGSR